MNCVEKFCAWILEPLVAEEKKDNSVLITDKKSIFRPRTFDEYIGQYKAKELIQNYIKGTNKRQAVFPHTIISGSAGMGKTTLVEIIARELQKKYCYKIATEIVDKNHIVHLTKLVDGGILMIDEIHGMKRNIAELFYPIMEDFREVSPFTLIGATTEMGEIIEDRKPFYDRFRIIIELDSYDLECLVKIASQYRYQIFPDEKINNQIYLTLAKNCRNTPRHLIRLLEATIYFEGDINKVLKAFNIIKDGLTVKDLKILEYLAQNEKGAGLNSIANYLDTSAQNYIYNFEPYLLQSGLLVRTGRGRKLTSKGKEVLKELYGSN